VKALCDLGALPQDTDIDAVIRDLGLDQPTIDPTTLSGEELVREVQRIVKALLAYGAKLPKELMLYVKNMVFLDGAIARLAPDLDIIGELTSISMTFMQRHGMRLAQELGVNPDDIEIDMGSLKAGLGVSESTETLTYRQLQERRDLINRRMRDHIGI
jgi:ubiquinone biosynthesis protein